MRIGRQAAFRITDADLIRHRAKVELYEGSLINPARADRERILEAETLAKLLKRTNEMSATNTLKGDL